MGCGRHDLAHWPLPPVQPRCCLPPLLLLPRSCCCCFQQALGAGEVAGLHSAGHELLPPQAVQQQNLLPSTLPLLKLQTASAAHKQQQCTSTPAAQNS